MQKKKESCLTHRCSATRSTRVALLSFLASFQTICAALKSCGEQCGRKKAPEVGSLEEMWCGEEKQQRQARRHMKDGTLELELRQMKSKVKRKKKRKMLTELKEKMMKVNKKKLKKKEMKMTMKKYV